MSYEILAKVKFNSGIALVLNRKPVFEYQRRGCLMWGTDELFYTCYKNEGMGATWKAFAGRKFEIKLKDGEVIECKGQWWDAGQNRIADLLGIKFCSVTIGTIEALRRCYVFQGASADRAKYLDLLESYKDMPVYEYNDYEKIIKYNSERSRLWRQIEKLKRDKRELIRVVKEKHAQIAV